MPKPPETTPRSKPKAHAPPAAATTTKRPDPPGAKPPAPIAGRGKPPR